MRAAILRCGLVVGPVVFWPPCAKAKKLIIKKLSREGGLVLLQSAGMEEWDNMEWRPRSGKHFDGVGELDIVQFFDIPAVAALQGTPKDEGGAKG